MSDLIYRKKVIKIVHQTIYEFMDVDNDGQPITSEDRMLLSVNKAICNKIKDLPSEENTGEWHIYYGEKIYAGFAVKTIYCSNCGMVSVSKTNYCPHCGARMEE